MGGQMTGLPVALSAARDGFAPLDPSHRPLVSIVLPCFREPIPILQRTLDSVLSQTYPNIEILVVVEDPGNAAILTHLKRQAEADNCVRVVVHQHNLGAC